MNNKVLALTATVAAVMSAGCTANADRSGGEIEPVTVVLASNDGTQTSGALARFVTLVRDLSKGRIEVEVSPEWRNKGEQRVLEDVAAGKAELGWSGTRAFDTIGIDAFRALHAPFLIRTYPAQRSVMGDSVVEEMLAALPASKLTGLAVLADELRFPAAAEHPLLEPADFRGLYFGTMASNVQSAGIAALGARAKAMPFPHSPGTDGLEGLETMWATYVSNGQQRIMPFVTSNAVLWPRTTVLVANPDALAELNERDRDVIAEAAARAASWSLEHADDQVATEMSAACATGARIATVSTDQLAALREAAEPAYTALRAEPEQAARLGRIEQLVSGTGGDHPVDVPDDCAYRPGDEDRRAVRVLPARLTGPGRPGALPAGTYRYTISADEIQGALDVPDDFTVANAGVWTWTLGDGRWFYELKPYSQETPEGYSGNTCEGYYDVHGAQVDFTTLTVYAGAGDCASETWKADWRETPDGLVMDVTTDADDLDFLFGSEPWRLIR